MAVIQPRNTTGIKVDTLEEKTSTAGVSCLDTLKVDSIAEVTAANGIVIDGLKIKDGNLEGQSNNDIVVKTGGSSRHTISGTAGHITPASDNTINLGSTSLHYQYVYASALRSSGQALALRTDTAHDIELYINGAKRLWLTDDAELFMKSHDNYTGSQIRRKTGKQSTFSTTPATLITYDTSDISGPCKVMLWARVFTRDATGGTNQVQEVVAYADKATSTLASSSITQLHTTGTATCAVTVSLSGGNFSLQVANSSGTNTQHHICDATLCVVKDDN